MLRKKKVILLSFLILVVIFAAGGCFLFQKLKISPDLEGFYALTKEDPLFYSPFLDSKELGATLERLKKAEVRLKEVSIKSYLKNSDPLNDEGLLYKEILTKTNVFPYQLWETLILINQETDNFLESPSLEKANTLLALYEIAADSYLHDISALIKVIESIEEEEREKTLLLVDSQTNLDIILADYHTIKRNAYALKEEIDQRGKCLKGNASCLELRREHDIDYFMQLLEQGLFPQPEELKPETELVKHFISIVFPKGETRGPYKIESACWQSPDNSHWMYLFYGNREDVSFAVPRLSDQNYYQKIEIPFLHRMEEVLAKKGLNFRAVTETTHYRCTDLTFYLTLLTLDFLNKKMVKRGAGSEKLANEGQYKLLVENQFSLLPPAINYISWVVNTHAQLLTLNREPLPLLFLYGLEPAYSIFYLPYACSVWRLDEKLQYLVPKEEKIPIAQVDKRLYKLSELKDRGYSEEKIKRFHVDGLRIIESLLEQENF